MKVTSTKKRQDGSTTFFLSDGTHHNIYYNSFSDRKKPMCTFKRLTDEYELVQDTCIAYVKSQRK